MREQENGKGTGQRRGVLDAVRRRTIVTLLTGGCSRRAAARWVGWAASTINRTAGRDPEFADQLAKAEDSTPVEALRMIRPARKERHWRASAWLLERKKPGGSSPSWRNDFNRAFEHVLRGWLMTWIITWFVTSLQQPR